MKGIKKVLALFLAALMILAASPAAFAADGTQDGTQTGTETEPTTEEPVAPVAAWYTSFGLKNGEGTLAEAVAAVPKNGRITLLADIELTETVDFSISATVDGAGHTIIRNAEFGSVMFTVSENAKITFKNVTISGNSENYAGSTDSVMNIIDGDVILDSGAKITDNYATGYAGTIAVGYGNTDANVETSLTMKDGSEISNCTALYGGAAALYAGAVFNMRGGVISGCKAVSDGGAVYSAGSGAQFNMLAGEITGCESGLKGSGKGSAVAVTNGASATLTDCKIYGNTSDYSLGSVYAYAGSSLTVGGNVYVYDNKGAEGEGSNIYIEEGGVITVAPEFADGAKIGVTVQNMDKDNPTLDFIKSENDIMGFVYSDEDGSTFYVSNGVVTLIDCITVTFDPGNGTCSVKSKIYPIDVDFSWLPEPDARDGFEFLGWYTADGVHITESSPVSFTSDITLYAKWENLNELDMNPFAVIGRFFERIAEMMRIAFRFLTNLFTGSGDRNIEKL